MSDATTYNRNFCNSLQEFSYINSKSILDVGCGNGDLVRYIATHYKPKYIIGIEPALEVYWDASECSGENWRVQYGDVEHIDFDDNTFDLVISYSTFEHINEIDIALNEVKRVLKPYGRFYTEFMPIWTSAAGHHFLHGKDRWWTPEHILSIPPWGHLYLTEIEMKQHLEYLINDKSLVEEILSYIYHSNYINRRSRSELSHAFFTSQMIVKCYEERVSFNRLGFITGEKTSELTNDIIDSIKKTKYNVEDIGVAGLRVCLEKYSSL